jgi:hypothetical protein
MAPAASAIAQEQKDDNSIPLRRLIMYTSGVGYFEHRGAVEGEAEVEFRFDTADINDLLKSMVLQDFGGGRITTVTYGSRDPITRTLKTFSVDLTENPTVFDLLRQLRGERVEIEAPNKVAGTIVDVESRQKAVKDEGQVRYDLVNLLTDDGLRSVPLDQVVTIRFLDEEIQNEFRQALQTLARAKSNEKKSVTLNFEGEGRRDVRVGYIKEMPVWKTSYRLVLDDEDPPFLQGWAIVENTTDSDWENVELTLVSGRPISFRMDLYQPLYAQRPMVVPELFASLRPQVYGQDLARSEAEFEKLSELGDPSAESLGRRRMAGAMGAGMGGMGGALFGGQPPAAAPAPADEAQQDRYGMNLGEGVRSMAEAGEVGELFRYQIDTPVALARQRSAMLPIVNADVEGEKLSIYNEGVQQKHPLNGIRLKNATEVHLMQGPITVFDGGAYAGDARIEDIPPGSERLISYALDLDVEVAPEHQPVTDALQSVRIIRGTLQTERKLRRSAKYSIRNSSDREKKVLIEYPRSAGWTLVTPKEATEQTRDLYRFAVQAEPGEPAELAVALEQITEQRIALTNLDDQTIQLYLDAKAVGEKTKEALREIVRRKQQIAEVETQRQQLDQHVRAITEEQSRIRQNMAQLDRNSELYSRYVKKFGAQEDEIERLREEINTVQSRLNERREALDKYMQELTVE